MALDFGAARTGVAVSDPTTAGISRDRAMMAVCEVFPPMSVTKAVTLSFTI